MQPIKTSTLWSETYDALSREILSMRRGENRLPSEEELSRTLGVSRATVREAMQALVHDGLVTRRHGKGNFGHPSVSGLTHRMDLSADLLVLLSAGGKEASCRCLKSGFAPSSPMMRKRYPIPCERVFFQNWLYEADGLPAVFCRVETPAELLPEDPGVPEDCRLGQWLSRLCGSDVAYYATHMLCRADPAAARALELPAEQALLDWQEILYDIRDYPVSFCELCFHPERMDLSMVLRF